MKSKEYTGRSKGMKRLSLLVLALFFVSCLTGMAVSAASWPNTTSYWWDGAYRIHPANEEYPSSGGGEVDTTRMDGKAVFSTEQIVNFGGDKIFSATNNDRFSSVKRFEITTTDVTKNSPIQLTLDVGKNDKNWQAVEQDLVHTKLVYSSSSSISYGDFNNMMKKISLSFDETKGVNSASATFTIKAYNAKGGGDENGLNGTQKDKSYWSDSNNTVKSYNCTVIFYSYASGEIVDGSEKITYQGEDTNFEDGILISPTDENGMQVDFQMQITNFSSEIQTGVEYGYQVKKAEEQWSDQTPYEKVGDVKKEDDHSNPLDVKVEGLSDGTTYNIRGVFITDGKTDSPKYTEEITVRYVKPVINSFTVGNTEKSYKGGSDAETMYPTLEATYSNTSYDDTVTTKDDETSVIGPIVKTELFFTSDRTLNEDGTVDTSKWVSIGSKEENLMTPEGDINRQFQYSTQFLLEKDPAGGEGETVNLDSDSCAYMIKVTDVISGYSVYQFSDTFAVDSTKPTAPTVVAYRPVIEDGVVTGEEVVEDTDEPISGAGGSVKIEISGSEEYGSGLKEYQYSMYYLTASQGDKLGATIPAVYEQMKAYTSSSHGDAEYVSWTSVSLEEGKEIPTGIFNVAKDGYYRIMVQAVDKADRISDAGKDLYLRVDLAVPNTPEVYLAKVTQEASGEGMPTFGPYDNRSYTNDKVWLFAKSQPQTGKTLTAYEYSIDGGLSWSTFADQPGYTDVDGSVRVYENGQYTSEITFNYDVAFNLSAVLDDYNSIIVRARDNLNNNSSSSAPVVMRTVGKTPTATSDIEHVGIEVALAMGNTTMKTSTLTPDLKNEAAKKINAAYYGTSGNTTMGDAAFNPYLYVGSHKCSWGDDPACEGACINGASCPYAKLEAAGYSIYKPEIVNIQGISSADASVGMTWYHYDHTSLASFASSAKGLGAEYKNPNGKYNAMDDYVKTTGFNDTSSWEDLNPSAAGEFNQKVAKRIYHMMPFPNSSATVNLNSSYQINQIRSFGYYTGYIRDWMFLYNNQPAKKNIGFTIDDSKVYPHSNDGYGFLFNTTIRQNKSGSWVVSGYLFNIAKYNNTGGNSIDSYAWGLIKLVDAPIDSLMDGGGSYSGSTTAFPNHMISKYNSGLYTTNAVRHFRIITEGSTSKIYCYQGMPNATVEQLEEKFNSDTNYGETDGASSYTSGYKAIPLGSGSSTTISTPRPTVDGETIGASGNSNHVDTNCYGFGPIVGSTSQGHTCTTDTQIIFSNMVLKMNVVRTLSEVVTEPQWGNGKAKFIANISDDAVEDFKDPALNAQIQWRLYNDNAKYIGWGIAANEAETTNFLKRMAGEDATAAELAKIGMYQSNQVAYDTQINNVATYITSQYYVAFGYDVNKGPVKDQILPEGAVGKGTIFTLDDIGSMKFEVDPEKYLTSSANPDFPAGRWYMVHDSSNGGGGVTDVRNETYSDALEFNITLPGRYAIYFAPDSAAVSSGLLDPKDAVFNFVVNQKPVALFNGSIANDTLTITDSSYDPDGTANFNGQQISGIYKREWRYELLIKDSSGTNAVVTTNWSTDSPNGKTIASLTQNKYTSLPNEAVLTIYERVTDKVATREAVYGPNGEVTGYTYVPQDGSTSTVCQRNITKESQPITNPPLSTMALDKVYMYDTASGATDPANKVITVTRNSSHPQGKPFAVSWAIDMSAMGDAYQDAVPDTNEAGNNYIPLVGDNNNDYYVTLKGKRVLVLECVTDPVSTGNIGNGKQGSTGGVWQVPYSFISQYVTKGKSMVLQITETSYGNNGTTTTEIKDQSARAIFYQQDTLAPSPQTVITKTVTTAANGEETISDYEASKFLDVTDGSKSIRITASGSKDGQGRLAGYAYYLYTKNSSGNVAAYYKLNTDGTLTKQTTAKDAMIQVTTGDAVIDLTEKILPEGSPSLSVSVAIWAYDNQTGMTGNLTGANETKPTKIEDIKFTRSEPMPPTITASDSTGKTVSKIANDNGYFGSTGTDTESSPDGLDFWSSTDVTVKFQPRQDKYKQDPATGNYVKSQDADAQLFYEDIYKAADLTNTATIRYTAYKKDASGEYQVISEMNNAEIPSTSTLTFSDTGEYKLEAIVVNGANAQSKPRVIHFNVDKEAPTTPTVNYFDIMAGGKPYVTGTYSNNVSVTVENSTDNYSDYAYYQISTNGGASWQVMDQPTPGLFQHTMSFTKTGTYQVRIRAVDKAGNTSQTLSQTVQIDSTPPVVPTPDVTVRSSDETQFTSYLVYLEQQGPGQLYFRGEDGKENHRDTIVSVDLNGSKDFLLKPDSGAKLQTLTYGGEDVTEQVVDNTDGTFTYTAENVNADKVLSAVFASTASSASVKQTTPETETAAQMFFAAASVMRTSTGAAIPDTMSAAEKGEEPAAGEDTFAITVNDVYYAASASPDKVAAGGSTTITISRPEDVILDSVTVTRDGSEPENVTKDCLKTFNGSTYQWQIDNIQQNITVDVQWKEAASTVHTMTVTQEGAVGSTEIVDTTSSGFKENLGAGKYAVYGGDLLKVRVSPGAGYALSSIEIDGSPIEDFIAGSNDYWIDIPDKDFTLKFKYELIGDSKITIRAEVLAGEDGLTHGAITPSDNTEIGLVDGKADVKFTITPDPGYEPEEVLLYLWDDFTMGYNRTVVYPTAEGDGTWVFTAEGDQSLTHDMEGITVKFRKKVVSVTTSVSPSEGGVINCKSGSASDIPEGSTVTFEIVPASGYQIKDVQVDGQSVGKVSTYTFQAIRNNATLAAYFEKRTQGDAKTSHSITVAANSVTDAGVGLEDVQRYSFNISDGEHDGKFTERQAGNTYTFTSLETESGEVYALQPNTAYTITVRAYDKCGNIGENSKTVYTLANEPKLNSAREVESPSGVTTKTVMLSVNPRENSNEDTEYLVYYSTYENMQNASVANADTNGGWAKLNNTNDFQVSGLDAGTRYYFQIVARNKDGKQTNKSASNIVDIQLSPSAPPEFSMWFDEQASPGDNILLGWDTPPSDVTSVEIYRDGALIASVPSSTTQYIDKSVVQGGTVRGDAVTTYSYAFVNSAGTGSKRNAISKEYYDAWNDALESQNPDGSGTADATKYTAMDHLTTLTKNEGLFEQVMTYPAWPKGVNVVLNSMMEDGNTNSGQIALFVTTDKTAVMRSQRYELYLQAFTPDPTGEGTPTPVPGWDTGKYTVSAVSTSSSGAYAQWTGLNTDYLYQVMVKSISSTGAYTTNESGACISGYDGSKTGIEFSLGKTYTVTADGYSITYEDPNKYDGVELLNTVNKSWTETDVAKTKYTWSEPISGAGNYIEFNKSPVVKAPEGAAIYADADKVKTDSDNGKYLLVDKSSGSMTFRLNVIAYDLDGSPEYKKPSISGSIAGVNGTSVQKIDKLWDNEVDAQNPENYYQVEFDASKLDTGVYDEVTLQVSDGEVSREITVKNVKIVVNQSYPEITVQDNTFTRKLESTRTYPEKGVTASADVAKGVTDPDVLRTIRLAVFSETYKTLFEADTVQGITEKLKVPGSTAVNNAKQLMGDTWFNQNNTGGAITNPTAIQQVIDGVRPKISSYFMTDEATYNTVPAESRDLVVLPNGDKQYWIETEYALAYNKCDWLERTGDSVKVIASPNTVAKQVRLKAAFGGNITTVSLYFQIVEPSSMTIETKRRWVWDEHRPEEEYTEYREKGMTVQMAFDAEAGNSDRPELTDEMLTEMGITRDTPAYQVKYLGEDGWHTDDITDTEKTIENIRIFRVVDDHVTVSNDSITGTVNLVTGAYEKVKEAFIILDSDGSFDPETGVIGPGQTKVEIRNSENSVELKSGAYNFYASGLNAKTTYHLWTGYTVGEGADQKTYYAEEYVTVTTDDNFIASYYGFDQKEAAFYESDLNSGTTKPVTLSVRREKNTDQTSAVLKATIQYLKADQFGNLILDGDGAPIPLTGQELTYAQQTLNFTGGTDTVTFTQSANDTRQNLSLTLTANDVKQGHMIARVTLDVDRTNPGTEGNNYMFQNGKVMDVFVQDDEDEITSFEIGIDNTEGKLTEVKNLSGVLDYYSYQMEGVQVGYGSSEILTVSYQNTGTGELNNIQASFYTTKNGTQTSDIFRLVQQPTAYLPTVETDPNARGQVMVTAASALGDGVHEAWMKITADNVKTPIWVKLTQVVGQSTLQGRIYITSVVPQDGQLVGSATVSLYSDETSAALEKDPLYTVETNLNGGTFRIPNILNDRDYYIVVKRDGYLMYNGVSKSVAFRPTESQTYEFSLQLLAGDIDGNGIVETADYNTLLGCFNQSYDMNEKPADPQELEHWELLKRCDLNYNGVVNALDRMALQANIGKTSSSYEPIVPTLVQGS